MLPNSSKEICDVSNMCWDESSENNRVLCVEKSNCRKLVTYFQLKGIDEAKPQKCFINHNEKLKTVLTDSSSKMLSRIRRNVIVKDEAVDQYVGSTLVPNSLQLTDLNFPTAMIDFYENDPKTFIANIVVLSTTLALLVICLLLIVATSFKAVTHYQRGMIFILTFFSYKESKLINVDDKSERLGGQQNNYVLLVDESNPTRSRDIE